MPSIRFLFVTLIFATANLLGVRSHAAPEVSESVITASLPGRSISALVTHQREHDVFRQAVVLLPGYPGIMKIESDTAYALKGNFLIRSRHAWLDRETVVFSVDAPSDEWTRFSGQFRASARYAEDIRALADVIRQRYGALPLAIVGTSEGSVSAYYVAKALQGPHVKVIFSASLFLSQRNAQGLETLDFENFGMPMLWVHHADDPCQYTPFQEARRHAEKTRAPLITVKSSNAGRGAACQAFTQHGFVGVEEDTVQAMKNWLQHGVVADVVKP